MHSAFAELLYVTDCGHDMSTEFAPTTAEYWQKCWRDNAFDWHRDTVNKFLIKYVHKLTGGRSNLRVFVPLCGKSLDMLWLAEQNHKVVGVELAKEAIESFFQENSLSFTSEKVKLAASVDQVDSYKCVEKEITIFCCDLFMVSAEDFGGRFDAIWDRGSLSAVNPAVGDRGKRYTEKMRSILGDDGSYMLESHYYWVDRGTKPPACISEELRNELFGEEFVLEELEVERSTADFERKWGYAEELHYHLIKPKTN